MLVCPVVPLSPCPRPHTLAFLEKWEPPSSVGFCVGLFPDLFLSKMMFETHRRDAHTHTHTRARTHTRAYTRTHTRTHTHTHTHTHCTGTEGQRDAGTEREPVQWLHYNHTPTQREREKRQRREEKGKSEERGDSEGREREREGEKMGEERGETQEGGKSREKRGGREERDGG
ncbi:hypothetical protein NL108_017480 [Boleophthalmus pectinirostris]|nr:hypothetical protein NL108_017480 [Boleophthalmus pectinirostris]